MASSFESFGTYAWQNMLCKTDLITTFYHKFDTPFTKFYTLFTLYMEDLLAIVEHLDPHF